MGGMKRSLLFLVLSCGIVRVAFADSDGYFCISKGYIAYELRPWSVPENRHVMRIIRVGGKEGISEHVSVLLDDFQLHGMKCESDKVIIFGWDNRYTIDLKEGTGPKVVSVEPLEANRIPGEFQVPTFRYVGTKLLEIPSQDIDRQYQLQIQSRERSRIKPGKGGIIYHETAAKVIEKDLLGNIIKEREVYRAVRQETIH